MALGFTPLIMGMADASPVRLVAKVLSQDTGVSAKSERVFFFQSEHLSRVPSDVDQYMLPRSVSWSSTHCEACARTVCCDGKAPSETMIEPVDLCSGIFSAPHVVSLRRHRTFWIAI